jgi:predicted SAM-dependent methyltransferase
MAENIKLNVGCGGKLLDGFINIDLDNNWADTKPDVIADVTKPLPFDHNYADEIHAYHLIEHLNRWETPNILNDWVRVLKPGGLLVLECPCLDKIVSIYAHALIEGKTPDPRLTIMGLFGDPGYKNEAMSHRWCYSVAELAAGLEKLGLEDIQEQPPQTHQPRRDMRIVSRKPWPRIIQP